MWKSQFLLFNLYYQYLLKIGVDASHILAIPLDDESYEEFEGQNETQRIYLQQDERFGNVLYISG